MKIIDKIIECGKTIGDDVPMRIWIKVNGGLWKKNPYWTYDHRSIYDSEESATGRMDVTDVVIEYVAVTRYRCKVDRERT